MIDMRGVSLSDVNRDGTNTDQSQDAGEGSLTLTLSPRGEGMRHVLDGSGIFAF
jgi:hypothetical protein